MAHVLLIGVIIGGTILGRNIVNKAIAKPSVETKLIDPGDYIPLKPAKTQAGGGGGGGDRDVLQASEGRLPKFSMQQITPPTGSSATTHPKLAVEPTIVIPPRSSWRSATTCRTWAIPCRSHLPSNGTGSGSGIGSGSGGGVGTGRGPGFGPGEGGGTGGGVFRVGAGVSPPRTIYQPEPEFSEEARKAKYQGACTLGLIVGADGRPTNIRVVKSAWAWASTKKPSRRSKLEVRAGQERWTHRGVEIAVEVDFHLY